jgi:uncharacterized protein YidB (DUF937 family)
MERAGSSGVSAGRRAGYRRWYGEKQARAAGRPAPGRPAVPRRARGAERDMAETDLGRRMSGLIGEERGGTGGALLGSLIGALGSGGGQSVSGLVQQLREGGLGDAVGSWVSDGPNRAVSGPDIAQALPYQTLDHAARESGLTPEQAADRIAGALPAAVDRLTPGGSVPDGTLDDAIRATGA